MEHSLTVFFNVCITKKKKCSQLKKKKKKNTEQIKTLAFC